MVLHPIILTQLGADLRNEPRGIYCPWSTWAPAAEEASEALLEMQPNWLMFVEGIASANDCSGARKRPIKLTIPDRVVYSSHVYVSAIQCGIWAKFISDLRYRHGVDGARFAGMDLRNTPSGHTNHSRKLWITSGKFLQDFAESKLIFRL
jgi:hypothetical protein